MHPFPKNFHFQRIPGEKTTRPNDLYPRLRWRKCSPSRISSPTQTIFPRRNEVHVRSIAHVDKDASAGERRRFWLARLANRLGSRSINPIPDPLLPPDLLYFLARSVVFPRSEGKKNLSVTKDDPSRATLKYHCDAAIAVLGKNSCGAEFHLRNEGGEILGYFLRFSNRAPAHFCLFPGLDLSVTAADAGA